MLDQVNANKRRSALLLAAFVVAVAAVASVVNLVAGGGIAGLLAALVVAAATALAAYWRSDAVALGLSHARPADPTEHARLHNLVEGLCVAAGLPKPAVYVIEDDALNAFATGRDPRHAAVAVTTGLLASMSRIELEGVLAHELSHVKSQDILVSTLAVTTVGFVALASDWWLRSGWGGGPRHRPDRRGRGRARGAAAVLAAPGFLLLPLAPLAARLMRLAVGRRRELVADVMGVALTRYPPGLVSALEKLRSGPTVVRSASPATAHLWIESPVAQGGSEGKLAWLGRLFDSHPPIDQRIQALSEL
ncbi:MAG: M48 family metallopeptidase [Actinomycetota bacterium]|nr:M48 family metallopeptidase [Actinomycetota bacterium]